MKHRARPVLVVLAIVGVGLMSGCESDRPSSPKGRASGPKGVVKDAEARTVRILFVGNSYTYVNELPDVLRTMASSADPPVTIETEKCTGGGTTLERHWADESLRKRIATGRWDVVVLQEQSTRPVFNPDNTRLFAGRLSEKITKAGAQTVLFMTWARRNKPEMIEPLAATYDQAGRECGAVVAPVGRAWAAALADDPNLPLYADDNSHPKPHGTYLTACVFYSVLFGRSPQGLSNGGLKDLSREDAAALQTVAWRTVRAHHESR